MKDNLFVFHSHSESAEEHVSTRSKVIEVWQKRTKVSTDPFRADRIDSSFSLHQSSLKFVRNRVHALALVLAPIRANARVNVRNPPNKVPHSISKHSVKKSSLPSSKPFLNAFHLSACLHTCSFSLTSLDASYERVRLRARRSIGQDMMAELKQSDENRSKSKEKQRLPEVVKYE